MSNETVASLLINIIKAANNALNANRRKAQPRKANAGGGMRECDRCKYHASGTLYQIPRHP